MGKIDHDSLLEFSESFHKEAQGIMKRKNQDYAGDKTTPFANFRACEDLGITQTEVGILIRILDKMKRIISFVNRGDLKVKGESVVDAALDIRNYLVLFLAEQYDCGNIDIEFYGESTEGDEVHNDS